ncbi:hypothetical protein Ocin01_04115 [Orchesella cincta]|uniref:Uncharacterized protein n=1 Tax=Orchesella cincta TaxID=48709 RepID=A0A1D2NBF1_ORCCI|nr:hypothetical protein Ocin01_04115 [Orchesella cincta]
MEEILNTHLCPDPVISWGSSKSSETFDTSKVIAIIERSVKLKYRTVSYLSRFIPCTFIEDTENGLLGDEINPNETQISIKSINLHTQPWDFMSAPECSKLIMFKSWADYGKGYPPVTCGRDNYDQYLGPYGHPIILYYHLKDQGIAFPLFHPNYGQKNSDQKGTQELKYMLIYYSIRKNGMRSCRLQQYVLDPLQKGCSSTEPNCGEYDCTELETLYQKQLGRIRSSCSTVEFLSIHIFCIMFIS